MKQEKLGKKIHDQRELLNWLQQHPEVSVSFKNEFPMFPHESGEFFEIVKTLGNFEKKITGEDLVITKRFGSASFDITIPLSAVGEKTMVMQEVPEWSFPELPVENEQAAEPGPALSRTDKMLMLGFVFDGRTFKLNGTSIQLSDIERADEAAFDRLLTRLEPVVAAAAQGGHS